MARVMLRVFLEVQSILSFIPYLPGGGGGRIELWMTPSLFPCYTCFRGRVP